MSVKLIQAGDFVTREFPIEVDDFTIGREYTCDLRLDHGRISRNHCRILKRGNRVLVEALYSTAGTAVNQKILDPTHPPVEVHHGDHLWVGPEHFQFAITLDPGQSANVAQKEGDGDPPENPLLKDVKAAQSRAAHQILERISATAGGGEEPPLPPPEPPPAVAAQPQGSLDVTEMDGVALVRLLPKAIVADSDIRTITEGLGELIDSGQNCITLHLGNVERMSSQVIGEVIQVYRRCKAKGGMLKICQVTPQVAGVFAMTNMQRHIEIFPDERLALKSVWPRQAPAIPKAVIPHIDDIKAVPSPASAPPGVQLIVEVGRAKGRAIDLRVPRFLIGRDQQCQLRPNSNGISRLHAAIEQRDGRVFVRDLGSQIGTVLNGRVLHNEEVEAFHGDRLEIEVLQFSFAITPRADAPGQNPTDGSLSGLFGAPSTDSSADTTIMALPDLPTRPAATLSSEPHDPRPKRPRHLTCDHVRGIAVVTLLIPDLSEESALSAVRVELETILGQPGQDRVVVRFDRVKALSRGAVVMFLARAQHLARTTGTMRFCGVSAPVGEFLDKTQLPLLIETYPTLDEAMNTPWES